MFLTLLIFGYLLNDSFEYQISCKFKTESTAFVISNGAPDGEWLSRDMAGYSYIKINKSDIYEKYSESSEIYSNNGWHRHTSGINGRNFNVASTQTVLTHYEDKNLREVITILDLSDSEKGSLATLTRFPFGDAALEEFPGYAPLVENGVGRCWLRR